MQNTGDAPSREFDWGLCPAAADFAQTLVADFLEHHRFAKGLAGRMLKETSTRFSDWIDHAVLPAADFSARDLEALGFEEDETPKTPDGERSFRHRGSCLFPLLLSPEGRIEIALKPEELEPIISRLRLEAAIAGKSWAPYRRAVLGAEGRHVLSAVARRGTGDFVSHDCGDGKDYAAVLSQLSGRKRDFGSDEEGMQQTCLLLKSAAGSLKRERLCDAFFRSERIHWQSRNRAGRLQAGRQDRLGLGWGNHDHHTYRSSRESFLALMEVFTTLGFEFRERYYAGEAAGWGAQILEHAACGIVVFADVDLHPDESEVDFPRQGLPHRKELGTVGLWVGLHGQSLLQAGMHHLAARFDFPRLGQDLEASGAKVMAPFSNFPFLKQAFTAGEAQKVSDARLDRLADESSVTAQQRAKFQAEGAIGSHLESLERNQGFKGFNKSSVTKIIQATDPRMQSALGA
jgi:hypothetical protein